MGKSSQAKGRKAELELAHILQEYGIPAQVGDPLNYGSQPDIQGILGVHCECKRCEALRLSEWMAQAERDAQRFQDGAPTLFYRRSREPWRVVMDLSDWVRFYNKEGRCKCGGRCSESKGTGNQDKT